ncbi:hypothetical protein QQ045_011551 [Rhodiola kirilowii]
MGNHSSPSPKPRSRMAEIGFNMLQLPSFRLAALTLMKSDELSNRFGVLTNNRQLISYAPSSYTEAQIKAITRSDFTCQSGKKYRVEDLNYPSFAVPASTSSNATTTVTYARTLTNVGNAGTYTASVSSQTLSAKIVISPSSLSFSSYNEEKTYTVTFTGSSQASGTISSGHITWSDGTHTVNSPVAFNWS